MKKPATRPWLWGDSKKYLMDAAENEGADGEEFLTMFTESINAACRDEMIVPSEARIRSLSSGKTYQPVVHRRDSLLKGVYPVRVLFIQIPEPDAGARNLTFPAPPGE